MIRIAVVEDEKKEQESMRNYLKRFEEEHKEELQVSYYEDGCDFIEKFINQFDIVFCDIQMKFLGGIETAKKLREKNQSTILIFITNLSEFAIQGYEVNALDYILKPLSYAMLERCLTKCMERMEKARISYLSITEGNRLMRFPTQEILYIECCKHIQYIHTTTEVVKTMASLSSMEASLDSKEFMRCNSGCLVHLPMVQELKGNELRIGNEMLKISRYRKKEFVDALSEIMLQYL